MNILIAEDNFSMLCAIGDSLHKQLNFDVSKIPAAGKLDPAESAKKDAFIDACYAGKGVWLTRAQNDHRILLTGSLETTAAAIEEHVFDYGFFDHQLEHNKISTPVLAAFVQQLNCQHAFMLSVNPIGQKNAFAAECRGSGLDHFSLVQRVTSIDKSKIVTSVATVLTLA